MSHGVHRKPSWWRRVQARREAQRLRDLRAAREARLARKGRQMVQQMKAQTVR